MTREDKKERVQLHLNELIEEYVRLSRVYIARACSGMPCVPHGASEDDAVRLAGEHLKRLTDARSAMNTAELAAQREYAHWPGTGYLPASFLECVRRVRERACESENAV